MLSRFGFDQVTANVAEISNKWPKFYTLVFASVYYIKYMTHCYVGGSPMRFLFSFYRNIPVSSISL